MKARPGLLIAARIALVVVWSIVMASVVIVTFHFIERLSNVS